MNVVRNQVKHNVGTEEPTDTGKQPIRIRYLSHVTGYQPIRDQYFLIRSVPGIIVVLDRNYLVIGHFNMIIMASQFNDYPPTPHTELLFTSVFCAALSIAPIIGDIQTISVGVTLESNSSQR
eukprot:sb/3475930/